MKTLLTCLIAVGLFGTAFASPQKACAPFSKSSGPRDLNVFAHLPKPPAPSPENQLLAIWHGDWTYSGKVYDSPLGPGYAFSGVFTGRPILNGNATEFVKCEDGVYSCEVDFWDPAAGPFGAFSYISMACGDYAYITRGTYQMEGTTSIVKDTWVNDDGVEYTLDGREPLSADGRIFEVIFTLSWKEGGKVITVPFYYSKNIKVSRNCSDKR